MSKPRKPLKTLKKAAPPPKTPEEEDAPFLELPAHAPELIIVEEMLASGWTPSKIVEQLSRPKGKVHFTTVYRWIEKVEAHWQELGQKSRPIRKAQAREGLLKCIRVALAARPPQAAAAVTAWEKLTRLDALNDPEPAQEAPREDYSALSVEELVQLRNLQAKAQGKAEI